MLQLPASDAPRLQHTDLVEVGRLLETNVAQYFDAFNIWSKLGKERNAIAAAQHPSIDFSSCRGEGPEWNILESIGEANGYSAAGDLLGKIGNNIDDLTMVIDTTAPNSVEELRAYAWSALYDCFPIMLQHDGQFRFNSEVAFERLFNAVLNITGLAPITEKMREHWSKCSTVQASQCDR